MRRRLESPGLTYIWPAFTDVLSGLVVLLIFLATIFVIGEVLLGREVYNKDTAIAQLRGILDSLEALLGDSEGKRRTLQGRVGGLEESLTAREASLRQVRTELATADAERQRLAGQLASLEGESQELRQKLSDTTKALGSAEAERGSLREELSARDEALRSAETEKSQAEAARSALAEQSALLSARAERLQAELERLNHALSGTRDVLTEREATLTDTREALARATQRVEELAGRVTDQDEALQRNQTLIAEQTDRIAELDRLIKRRLLERVEELERYSSEFFGRLREVFAGNPDIRVVGDRFVFQSEVLFPSGSAELSESGKADLDKFVQVYRQVSDRLPPDLPVIIEVQGHTDRVPISTYRYRSNWELSAERALGVVDYLISRGIPAERLAATGMGEYHPIDSGDSPQALRRNRRIELKITSR